MSLISRHINILDFTLGSMLRRKRKNAALLLVYAAMVFVLGSIMFLTASLKKEAALILSDSPDVIIQRQIGGRHAPVPIGYLKDATAIRGVSSGMARVWGYYFDPVAGANYTMAASPAAVAFHPKKGEIVIGSGISTARRAYENDIMTFKAHGGQSLNLRIIKVLSSESELVAADLVIMEESDARELLGVPAGFATDMVLKVNNQSELNTIAKKLAERFPDTRPILKQELLRTYDAIFDWRGGMTIAAVFGAVLAFVIFALDRASGLSAEERREIGILKAVGWETSDVMAAKFWEGAAISLTAFLIGVMSAYVHVYYFSAGLFAPALMGWSVLYPELLLRPSFDYYRLATLFFLTVLPYTASTVIPSWRAATVDPDTIMRT